MVTKKLINSDFLKIMSYNARSVNKKVAGICEFLNDQHCDICFVCESWVDDSYTSIISEFEDYGFIALTEVRKGKRGGGLFTLYKTYLDVKKCNIKLKFKTFEVMETTIKSNSSLVRVSNVYRTGTMTNNDFTEFISELDGSFQPQCYHQ